MERDIGIGVGGATGVGDVAVPEPFGRIVQADDTSRHAVVMEHVSHSFRGNPALVDLSLVVPRGRITVLLGPNGAGKTTAIRAITGALEPDEGNVTTLGSDPVSDGGRVRSRCGVVSAKPALYDRLSGRDNLRFAAEIYGLGRHVDDRIETVAQRFGILGAIDQLVGGYSTGMKTRLALARSVVHEPELALFDEPTSGLDPESAHAVLALIEDMTYEGSTVVMCTHLLSEAEGLADHIVMMDSGRAAVAGSPESLIEEYWPQPTIELEAEDPRILDRLARWEGVSSYSRSESVASVAVSSLAVVPDLIISLVRDGARLCRIEPHQPTLEDLYFAIRRGSRPLDGSPPAPGDDPGATGHAPVATAHGSESSGRVTGGARGTGGGTGTAGDSPYVTDAFAGDNIR